MKTCCDCNQLKPLSAFVPKRNSHEPRCRICRAIRYNKADPQKVFRKIYLSQIDHSIQRGHPAPGYTFINLLDWAGRQPNATLIWDAYVASDYQSELRPSVDRINDVLPYTLSNIQLITWGDNLRKGASAKQAGLLNANQRRVMAISPDGMPHKTYHSIMDAVRDIKGHMSGITSVANGIPLKDGKGKLYQPKTYKGFIWKWIP